MGTSLTGLTPATTYDALIKVGDNGPLSATAKVLSDGLGNDSTLALSTTAVGIGTTSPQGNLDVKGSTNVEVFLRNASNGDTNTDGLLLGNVGGIPASYQIWNYENGFLRFGTNSAERVRIDAIGNVGIGTSTPQQKLHVAGIADNSYGLLTTATNWANNIFTGIKIGSTGDTYSAGVDLRSYSHYSTSAKTELALWVNNSANTMVEVVRATQNGLTFNGDTAAANALDDYEEGTWTIGLAFGGASVGVTTSSNTGTYTKIGRQVTVNGYLFLTSKGSSTGIARITGLPFTVANSNSNLSTASLFFQNITFANQFQAYAINNQQQISLEEITEAGVTSTITDADFANNSGIIISLTYFV